jgi:hypothetical protein
MKRTIAAAVISLAIAAPASAATVWQGDLFISAFSSTCVGVGLGYTAQGVYAPAGLPGNSGIDELNVFHTDTAGHWEPVTGSTLNGATSFNFWHIDNLAAVAHTPARTGATFNITPLNVAATTQMVTVSAVITGYNNVSTCQVTMHGVLAKRPGTLPD